MTKSRRSIWIWSPLSEIGDQIYVVVVGLLTIGAASTVHRPASELALRHVLWKARGAPVIAVLDEKLARTMPADLLRRSQNQRVHALAVNEVLSVMLGTRVIGAEDRHLRELALQNVDRLGEALGRRTLPTVVDRKLLGELLVDVSVGGDLRNQSPSSLLATLRRKLAQAEVKLIEAETLPDGQTLYRYRGPGGG